MSVTQLTTSLHSQCGCSVGNAGSVIQACPISHGDSRSSQMWYPTHDGNLSWQPRMTLSDVPPHFLGMGPSANNTSEGLASLSLPEYSVKGKAHGLFQPAQAWLPRSAQLCVFAPLLRDQCPRPSSLAWGSVRGAAANVPHRTCLATDHSSNIKFDEPTHSPLHVPRKAVHPGVHSAQFSQGIGPPRNECQQHACSRPHTHGRMSVRGYQGPQPTAPCRHPNHVGVSNYTHVVGICS